MNTKRKWYELLLPVLAVLLVLAVGAVQTARAGYVEDTDSDDTDKSSTIDETESTYIRKLQTLATANEGATSCHASFVENYVWTKGAYKQLDGYAESWVLKDWTWDPPPETPKGGNLTWSYSAEGKPLVAGQNIIPNPETQSALSIAGADSDTWATLTSSGPAYVFADAWGIVEDDDASDGDWDISDDPTATITDSAKTIGGSSYYVFVEYEIEDGDTDTIPRGTAYFYVRCDTRVASTATCSSSGGAESAAGITSTADADCDTTFVPNP